MPVEEAIALQAPERVQEKQGRSRLAWRLLAGNASPLGAIQRKGHGGSRRRLTDCCSRASILNWWASVAESSKPPRATPPGFRASAPPPPRPPTRRFEPHT